MPDSSQTHVVSLKLKLASTAAVLAIGAVLSPASAQVLFSMDYTAATEPNGGWSAKELKPQYSRSRVPGVGPSGEDAYELVQRYSPNTEGHGGQFTWGWDGTIEPSDPPQGSRRYYRWRMRFSPDTNFRGINWDDGSGSGMQNKLLIVGNTCGSRCRFILSYQADRNSAEVRNFRIQLDGGADLADTGSYPVGQWLNIQVELQSSSSPSTSNGGYKIWINSDNYSNPSAQRVGITLNPTIWRYVMLGAFMNDGLDSGGVHSFRQTSFEAATSFDNSWNTQQVPPDPPTDVRIQ